MNEMFFKALTIATKAHEGQTDKAGEQYILHPITVASQLEDETDQIVALLHDVLEDTSVSKEELATDFGEEIMEALDYLTKRDDENYFDYIRRAGQNPIAKRVKKADLLHNMELGRLDAFSDESDLMFEKYEKAYAMLVLGT